MNKIDKGFYEELYKFYEEIRTQYSDKNIFTDKNYAIKKYSRLNERDDFKKITSFFHYDKFTLPKLYNKNIFDRKKHCEYFFDENEKLICKKEFLNSTVSPEYTCFYVYSDDYKIRFRYKYQVLIGIHYCKFENKKIVQIDKIDIDYGITRLSGEIYEYENGLIARCICYDDYFMLQKYSKKSEKEILNCIITTENLIYSKDGKLNIISYKNGTDEFKPNEYAIKIIDKINNTAELERILLW